MSEDSDLVEWIVKTDNLIEIGRVKVSPSANEQTAIAIWALRNNKPVDVLRELRCRAVKAKE